MKLVGGNGSPFVRRTAITLGIYGMPVERIATDDPNYATVNPLGRVPSLVVDEATSVIDSNAIIDYLDEQAGDKRLTPASGAERREVLRLVAIAVGAAEKGVGAAYEQRFRPKELVHRPWLDKLLGQSVAGLKALDEAAAGKEWLALGRMTQADVSGAVAFQFMNWARPKLNLTSELPNMAKLSEKMAALPAFQANPLPG
jgi:glutathione S-transferase